MQRRPRLEVLGSTVHGVGRCNNREICFTTPADFRLQIAHLGEMTWSYEVTLYPYTLMANDGGRREAWGLVPGTDNEGPGQEPGGSRQ